MSLPFVHRKAEAAWSEATSISERSEEGVLSLQLIAQKMTSSL
ncbi:MAG: hypothetical protein ACQEWF_16440 [Bacillota bacterium]